MNNSYDRLLDLVVERRKDEAWVSAKRQAKNDQTIEYKMQALDNQLQGWTDPKNPHSIKPKKSIRDRLKNAITRPVRNLRQGMNDLENPK